MSFEMHGLDEFTDSLIHASKEAEKEQKRFLRQEGSKLARKTKARARAEVGMVARGDRAAGTYHASIKRGKVWRSETNTNAVRVYSNDPVSHLIEEGHDQLVNPGKGRGNGRGVKPGKGIGRKVGHVDGFEVFEKAREDFEDQFHRDCEEAMDKMIAKI